MNIIRKLLSKNKTDISFSTTSEPNNAVVDITNALDGVPFEPDESEISRINETIETITTDIVSREKSSVDADNVREGATVDAEVELKVADDNMSVTIILHGQVNGGKDLSVEDVLGVLSSNGIVYGIDRELITRKVENREYGEQFIGASGKPAKDGVDGRIIEVMPRTRTLSFIENDRGNVDFKNLNLVNQVKEGTVLCEIIPPEEPVNGMDVYGKVLEGKPGKAPVVPIGENTCLTEDGRHLIAYKDGNLVYSNDRFSVRERIEIPNDVDASTGNIEFTGDVTIKGSVLEGYTVRAGGNVTVFGVVEGSHIFAGGDVHLMQGINGMRKGVIEAKGSIICKFLEYCTIKADGSVSAEYILHSNVYSGASITVTGARSSIIGGTCSAYQTIEVRTVGSKTNTMTEIILGATKEMVEERKALLSEIAELEKKMDSFVLDLKYVERLVKEKLATEKHRNILLRIQEEYPVTKERLDICKNRYETLEELISNNTSSRLSCHHIYPPTRIRIGSESIVVQEERFRCDVYYSDGEIHFAYR